MHVYLRVNDQHTHPILPRLNENVHVVGFLEGKFEPRGGQVVSLQDPKHGGRGITLGLSSTFGGSGSPVFDEDGLLVGLLWGGRGATGEFQANGETHLNVYALSATAIIPFLIEAAVPIGTASPVDAPFKRGPQEGFWENVDKILNISRHVVVKLYCRKN